MRYKRGESFRFAFGSPLPAYFSIVKIDQELMDTSEGSAFLVDISPNGMKLSTSLDVPITDKTVFLGIRFTLNDTHFVTQGEILWKKQQYKDFHYGIQAHFEEGQQEKLIEELKIFAKKRT
ncbi:PilZ domain-containing protein [Bacillus sp. ISL-55]|uniref:PilZ domain-containing protein n=1 Tax=Bacillus sp. ISL-55 TaxID=2819134 RepID=UPI001BEA32E4|nr:PilZ domain-containing protein [Bacillus sp. ISL-55]MBT2693633.1 PilZ domain-containing protein [Bacillus sp. ISL-55]